MYRSRKSASFLGSEAFQRSFFPSGMSTSFTSGLPSRETCTNGPFESIVPSPRRTLIFRRLALA